MAKTGFWLRGGTGKLAGAALQKGANGETIIREIVTPKNPQTEAQMIQRIVMATVMQAYSRMKSITDHSFEGITAGQATMSQFLRLNANLLRQKVATEVEQGYDLGSIYAFSPLATKEFAPNEYIVSAGSLPAVDDLIQDSAQFVRLTALEQSGDPQDITYQDIINAYGLRRGDQLTFITITGTSQANATFHFARLILDPRDANNEPLPLSAILTDVDEYPTHWDPSTFSPKNPSPRNEGNLQLAYAPNGLLFNIDTATQNIIGAAVIVSRKDGDNWLRSNATMYSNPAYTAGFFRSMGECLDLANANNSVSTVSSRYLNNSGSTVPAERSVNVLAYDGANLTALSPVTLGTEVVSILGFREDNGYLKAVLPDGSLRYILNAGGDSMGYGKYATGLTTPFTATAPGDATVDNTVAVMCNPDDGRWGDAWVPFAIRNGMLASVAMGITS